MTRTTIFKMQCRNASSCDANHNVTQCACVIIYEVGPVRFAAAGRCIYMKKQGSLGIDVFLYQIERHRLLSIQSALCLG